MENVLYIVIIALLIVAIVAWFRSRQLPSDFPYQSQGRLLTSSELAFYDALQSTLSERRHLDDLVVFAKVRIADVINPGKALMGTDWQDAYARISSKHFDYVVCSAEDSQIRLIIEGDAGNQRSVKKLRRDHFLDQVCASASLPLLRVPAQPDYDAEELWTNISSKLLRPVENQAEDGSVQEDSFQSQSDREVPQP